jgi:hypothetical protein
VGKFGNSNPHFIEDWVAVEVEEGSDKTSSESEAIQNAGTCNFPSTYHVQIFYQKINTMKNP